MATKQETIDSIVPTSNYLGSFVRKMIEEIHTPRHFPDSFRKGDVIRVNFPQNKPRPSIVIKVMPDYVIAIPLTTDDNVHCMTESKSRFFKEGCFCNSYVLIPNIIAQENFLGVYDNMKLLNQAIKELKQFINKNI